MKKLIVFIIALCLTLSLPIVSYGDEKLDFVEAKSVVLMCLDNGEVIYKDNEYEHLSPASVTKIMPILLVLEAIDSGKIKLDDKVTVGEEAVKMGGSQIWLEVGEQMTVEELFKAVVVASANDACTALAEHIGGSTASFVKMMNDRAKELGCENTNFENCNGLDDTTVNHYSCAYDLALITCEVMKYDLVKKYTTIWLDSLRDGKTELNNTNKLVNTFNGITGLKTGTTSNAGFCISATAERDGMNLAAIVLGSETSEQRFDTAANLLDWGFANYELITPKIDEKKIKPIKVNGGYDKTVMPVYDKNSKILIKKGSDNFTYKYKIKSSVKAPVNKGDSLGEVIIESENKQVGKVNISADKNIKCISLTDIFYNIINNI